MLESVRKSHPRMTPPSVIDLAKDLPLPKDLSQSYCKLRELCVPGTKNSNSLSFFVFYFLWRIDYFFIIVHNFKTVNAKGSKCLQILQKGIFKISSYLSTHF